MNLARCLLLPVLLLFSGLVARAETFVSTDVPKSIPDGPAGIAESRLTVAVNRVIVDVNITLTITHPFDGDLGLYLLPPQGDLVRLAFRAGHAGDNYTATTFDDEAAVSVVNGAAPFTGPYIPDAPLHALDGAGTLGVWLLRVTDFAHGDSGTLQSWQIELTLGDTLAAPEPNLNNPISLTLAASPNPFNALTQIAFSLAQTGPVTLTVYNLWGQQVSLLADAVYPAGDYSHTFNGSGSGHWCLSRPPRGTAGHAQTTRLLLIK